MPQKHTVQTTNFHKQGIGPATPSSTFETKHLDSPSLNPLQLTLYLKLRRTPHIP